MASLCQELKRRQQIKEGFDGDNGNNGDNGAVVTQYAGVATGVIVVLVLISLAIWIWGLVVTLKYWKKLPSWAQIFAVLGLLPVLPLGPVVTLIVVYIGKGEKKS